MWSIRFNLPASYEINVAMPSLPPHESTEALVIVRGLPASPGIATGELVFLNDEALALSKEGRPFIFIKKQTLLEDVPAMMVAAGIVTQLGGLTCHAAIVARDLHKPCLVGCAGLRLEEDRLISEVGGKTVTLARGEGVVLDGSAGELRAIEQ